MLPARFSNSFELLQSNTWLLEEIILQLEKDSGYLEIFEEVENFKHLDQVLQTLIGTVSHLIKSNPDAFYALLYRVDLNELKLKTEMESGNYPSFEEVSAELILERVIQKVVTRNIYSGKITGP